MPEKLFLTLRALFRLVPVLMVSQSNWMILTSSKDQNDSKFLQKIIGINV